MMIRGALIAAVLVGAINLNVASAADRGQVSSSQLSSLGLGSMQKMSDTQGEQVRGKYVYSPAYVAYVTGLYTQYYGAAYGTYIANYLNNINLLYFNLYGPTAFGGYYGPAKHIVTYQGM